MEDTRNQIEVVPMLNLSNNSHSQSTNTLGNLVSINRNGFDNLSSGPFLQKHVSFSTVSHANSTRNKDTQVEKIINFDCLLWFKSRNKLEKVFVGLGFSVLALALLLLVSSLIIMYRKCKSCQNNTGSDINRDNQEESFQPVKISCPRGWYLLNGTFGRKSFAGCYHFGSQEKTQVASQEVCKARSGYLVEINSEVEHHVLSIKLQEIYLGNFKWNTWWIGLHYVPGDISDKNLTFKENLNERVEGSGSTNDATILNGDVEENEELFPVDSKWTWTSSGTSLANQTYTGWIENLTNVVSRDCVVIGYLSAWFWKPANCNQRNLFICEIDGNND